MNRFHAFSEKFLSLVHVRAVTAGLEVGDDFVRLAYFSDGLWQLHSVRLEPGTLVRGEVKDKEKFMTALAALRTESKIAPGNKKKKISVVVSLSSANIYSDVFKLPLLEGEALTKAVNLNLQMASPGDAASTSSGWEVVGKDESAAALEILSAFVDRTTVTAIVQCLFDAGFLTMAVEPRSIALTRILRERGAGITAGKPYLLLEIDTAGIDFLVIRNGLPYFEYTNPWKDIAEANGEISVEKFATELTRSLHQVTNFYGQHWGEPIAAIIIMSVTLNDVIEKTITETTTVPAMRLTLEMGQQISPEWLVSIGCSLRGTGMHFGTGEINLLGVEWQDTFRAEQVMAFIKFWQVLVPVAFVLLVALFFIADSFLVFTKNSIESDSKFTVNSAQADQLTALEASSTEFNNTVAIAQSAESVSDNDYSLLSAIQTVATADSITINQLSYPGSGASVSLSGSAPSEDHVLAFKTDLGNMQGFSDINLPPADVQQNGGTYAFQMTFNYSGK